MKLDYPVLETFCGEPVEIFTTEKELAERLIYKDCSEVTLEFEKLRDDLGYIRFFVQNFNGYRLRHASELCETNDHDLEYDNALVDWLHSIDWSYLPDNMSIEDIDSLQSYLADLDEEEDEAEINRIKQLILMLEEAA